MFYLSDISLYKPRFWAEKRSTNALFTEQERKKN
jgi:hypothetical protein